MCGFWHRAAFFSEVQGIMKFPSSLLKKTRPKIPKNKFQKHAEFAKLSRTKTILEKIAK